MKRAQRRDSLRRVVWKRAGGRCEICGEPTSDLQYHRRQVGLHDGWKQDTTETASNYLLLCLIDQRRVESYRWRAHECGHLLRSGQSPIAQPVLYRGHWMLLDDNGFTYRTVRPRVDTSGDCCASPNL